MSNVISLSDFKNKTVFDADAYSKKLASMHKIDMLDEMVAVSEDIAIFGLTDNLRARGVLLYKQLLLTSCTPELQELCNNMLKKLGA